MVTKYTYDNYSNNTAIEYPSGVTINKIYDNNGYLSEIWHGTEMLWKLNSSNGRGQPVNYNLGNLSNNLQVSFTYDAQGRVSGITTGQKKQTYSFDPASENLMSRDYRIVNAQTGLTEIFDYDSLNRLIKSKVIGGDSIFINYADNGNITGKSDAGDYSYDAVKINAVTGITGNQGTIDNRIQSISYNSYNLTTDIEVGDSTYTILCNPVNQRIKTSYTPAGEATVTRYYSGGYEKTVTGEGTKELHYINSPFGLVAIIVKQGETVQTYYVETDHLGSIIGLINPDKTYSDSASFDPWGRRRNPADWSYENVPAPQITDRGFTGHEHLVAFGLINMNGRMYDPVLGRFLGVDPVILEGTFSQSFNGYSYCWNNPLRYIDPSGYVRKDPISVAMELLNSPYGGSWEPGSMTVRRSYEEYNYLNLAFGLIVEELFPGRFGSLGGSINIEWCTITTDKIGGLGFSFNVKNKYEYYFAYNKTYGLSHLAFFGPYSEPVNKNPQGQGGGEIDFNDKEWFLVPLGINDLVNSAAEQSWETSVKSVRLGSVEAQVQRGFSKAVRATKFTGWIGNAVDLSVNYKNAFNNWDGPNSGFYNSKAVGATIIVGLNGLNFLVPGLGTVLSITAGVIDASGGFDWIYNELNK